MKQDQAKTMPPSAEQPELMEELETLALERWRSGEYTIGAAARSACEGLEAPEHVAMDMAERMRAL